MRALLSQHGGRFLSRLSPRFASSRPGAAARAEMAAHLMSHRRGVDDRPLPPPSPGAAAAGAGAGDDGDGEGLEVAPDGCRVRGACGGSTCGTPWRQLEATV